MLAVTELDQARALPRIALAEARALNRLYGACAPFELPVRDTRWTVRWRAPSRQAGRHDVYRFRLGAHTGQLGLDALAVAALLDEPRSEWLPRDLRYVLLAEALHALADALEKTLRLRFEWAPAEGDAGLRADAQAAFFSASSAQSQVGGFVQFDDVCALDTLVGAWGLPAPRPSAGFDWLRIPLPLCIGTTAMSLREIASVRPGDIVSIEQWASAGSALRVRAELGGPAGRTLLALAEGSRIIVQQWKDDAMNRDSPLSNAAPDNADAAGLPLDRLDALEVTLRFEVGELSVSLGELKSIRGGHVFDLTQPLNRSAVRILAHGNVLGKGHLVAVGDRLGVRVSEFAPSEI